MDFNRFQQLLDDQHDWPCDYTFKFVVPKDQVPAVQGLVPEAQCWTRSSRSGTYVSVTLKMHFHHSGEVVEVYKAASRIERIVVL